MRNVVARIAKRVLRRAGLYGAARACKMRPGAPLTDPAKRKDRIRKARQRLSELSERSTARIGARSWTRDELHER